MSEELRVSRDGNIDDLVGRLDARWDAASAEILRVREAGNSGADARAMLAGESDDDPPGDDGGGGDDAGPGGDDSPGGGDDAGPGGDDNPGGGDDAGPGGDDEGPFVDVDDGPDFIEIHPVFPDPE